MVRSVGVAAAARTGNPPSDASGGGDVSASIALSSCELSTGNALSCGEELSWDEELSCGDELSWGITAEAGAASGINATSSPASKGGEDCPPPLLLEKQPASVTTAAGRPNVRKLPAP